MGLVALALVNPLLDLLGRNPAYFVAQDFSSADILLFVAVVGVAAPLAIGALPVLAGRLVGPRTGGVVRGVLLAVFGALYVAVLARTSDLPPEAVAVGAVAAGLLLVVAHHRWAPVRTGLRLLGLAPFVFVGLFLAASPSARLLWQAGDAALADVQTDANVVVVVFDEWPLVSILDREGALDAEAFPNLARLAGGSHWYTNATTPSWTTSEAVPSLLTGIDVDDVDRLPTVADHPRNLFTLLGRSRHTVAVEEITSLCPRQVCADRSPVDEPGEGAPVTTGLADASVIVGHLVVPDEWAGWLPATDNSWGGFLDDAVSVDPVRTDPEAAPDMVSDGPVDGLSKWRDSGMPVGSDQSQRFARFVESIDGSRQPGLYAAHVILPHSPWVVTPDGFVYADREWQPGLEDNVWQTEAGARLGLQRQRLQVQHVDRLIGELIDRLEDEGMWDDTLLVVTGDHGAAFATGQHRREPVDETTGEIFWVPLFLKVPGQQAGEHHGEPVSLIDVLPTIVDALDLDPGWGFDGGSLLAPREPCAARQSHKEEAVVRLPCDDGPARSALQRNITRQAPEVPATTSGPSVAAALRFTPAPRTVAELTSVQRSSGRLPAALSFAITVPDPAWVPPSLIVTLDGRPAARIDGPFTPGTHAFVVLLDERAIEDGANTVDLIGIRPG